MIPPGIRRVRLKKGLGFTVIALLLSLPAEVFAQRGGHVAGGGRVAAPRMSAPSPRVTAPPRVTRPPAMAAQPRVQAPAISRPMPSHAVVRALVPRIAVPSAAPAFGTGVDFRMGSLAGSLGFRNRRRIFPRPPRFITPIFYPAFYPVGIFGFGGLGFCSPYWGWSPGCVGGAFGGDFFEPSYFYDGPVEPDYIPVPPDSNTAGEQDEVLLYLKDGTIFVISNYWLEDNKLHYLTSDGRDNSIDMDDVDLQTTVNVNAKRGVAFTLRAAPAGTSPQGGEQTPGPVQ